MPLHWPVTNQIEYDWLIGADGPASKIRKSIGGRVTQKPAVQYRMRLTGRDPDLLEFFFDEMLYAGKLKYGYGWVFPRGDIFNVGVAGTFSMLDAFLEKYNIRGEIVEKAGAPITINGTCFERDKIFLIGDAAGLTNPLSCGGLSSIICCADFLCQAIHSGQPGTYTKLIKANGFYPLDWSDKQHIFYQPQAILEKAGSISRGQQINPPSPAFFGRLLLQPALWGPLFKMAGHIRTFKRVSW